MSEEPIPIEDNICWCLDHSTYEAVARQFNITISEIQKLVHNYNVKQTDPVFRHCDHEFVLEVILHEIGIEYYGFCRLCKLQVAVKAQDLIKNHPNALIVKRTIKDCQKKVCDFCQ